MSALEVLPHTAPRETWLAARRDGIGGSDVPAILGLSRWSSPRSVYLDKKGRPDREPTWRMMIGTALEGSMLAYFTAHTGIEHQRVGLLRNESRPWMQVSLDALTDDGGIAECKWVGWRMADEWDDGQVSDHAELQAQWGMAVTDRDHAWAIAAISEDEPVFRRIERDQALIDTMIERAERFWVENVLAGVEPPLTAMDLAPIREEWPTVERVYALGDPVHAAAIERRSNAADVVKLWKQTQNQAEAVIVQALADADHLVIDGVVWATRTADKNGKRTLRIPAPDKRKALSPNG